MEHVHLGRSGLRVSRLCLGTMNFGWQIEESTSHEVMDAALDAGVDFFDTANVYGFGEHKGLSEEIIGRWFAADGGRRHRVVLATKLYGSMSDAPNDTFLSKRNIIRACEASLRRLQTDWIDLYQLHHVDRDTPFDEIFEAMETLVAQGKVLYVGSSNFAGWHLAKAQETARRRRFLGLVSEQSLYNLLERTVELEVLPAARDYGLGLLPWSPLGGGLLAGMVRQRAQGGRRASDERQRQLEPVRDQVARYEDLCDEWGHDPADVALAWLLHQEGVTAPIIGPRSLEQLQGNLRALDVTLDATALEALDEVFPGPGGPAPEAYAW